MSKPEDCLTKNLITDAEVQERFKVISPFIFESQKQYFDSLKFSLNMWTVINSGAAIALLNKDVQLYFWYIFTFLIGAVFSGIGTILLFEFSKECFRLSFRFTVDKQMTYGLFFEKIDLKLNKSHRIASFLLICSYMCFLGSVIFLQLIKKY